MCEKGFVEDARGYVFFSGTEKRWRIETLKTVVHGQKVGKKKTSGKRAMRVDSRRRGRLGVGKRIYQNHLRTALYK